MKKDLYPPVYYAEYLELNKILNAQNLKSDEYHDHAHDEMLFIIIHQTYELWFKQILFELDDIVRIFSGDFVDEKNLSVALARIKRVTEIQKIMIEQLHVLETMTPLDFLDFRDYLVPASGFQSFQFRLIENKLGLKKEDRLKYNSIDYDNTLKGEHKEQVTSVNVSLFNLVQDWLERIPFIKTDNFDFWQKYREAVDKLLLQDRAIIENNKSLSDEKRKSQLESFERTKESFLSLFDGNYHNSLIEKGEKRLSFKATLSALFINLYRDEPILFTPFQFLTAIVEMDEQFTIWRYRHAIMVHRMIGAKIGTGGSSGQHYLMSTVEKHRVFIDLFNLSTYLIPRSELPSLPDDLLTELGFYYDKIKR
ncbi:MAG: tryptophan 2,3-dioxygenase [Ignavibacteria bacterium]|nr:tryptophan 2,3-dioxygenase [Ignavibacteria bacterium]